MPTLRISFSYISRTTLRGFGSSHTELVIVCAVSSGVGVLSFPQYFLLSDHRVQKRAEVCFRSSLRYWEVSGVSVASYVVGQLSPIRNLHAQGEKLLSSFDFLQKIIKLD